MHSLQGVGSRQCGIERIVFEYLWMWITTFVTRVVCRMIALVMPSFLIIEGERNLFRNKHDEHITMELGASSNVEGEGVNKPIANLLLLEVYLILSSTQHPPSTRCNYSAALLSSRDNAFPTAAVFASVTFFIRVLQRSSIQVRPPGPRVKSRAQPPFHTQIYQQ